MNNYWTERSPREKMLLLVAAILFGVTAVFYFIISPAVAWREAGATSKAQAISTYEMVREAASLGAQATPTTSTQPDTPIRNTLIQSAREHSITLNFVNLRPDGNVEASVEAVNPEALFGWLGNLDGANGIRVLTADIARERTDNELVRAQFVFGR